MSPARARFIFLPLAAVVLAACGGGSSTGQQNGIANDSASQIAQMVRSALGSYSSVHMTGSVNSSGKNIGLDVIVVSPHGVDGTISISGSGSFRLITKDGATFYFTPDQQFWTTFAGSAGPAVLQQLIGKCVIATSATSGFGSLSSGVASLTDLQHAFASGLTGKITKGAVHTANGQEAVPLTVSDGTVVEVPTQGSALPVEISKGGGGKIELGQWNQAGTVSTPTGCVDINQLEQGLALPTPS